MYIWPCADEIVFRGGVSVQSPEGELQAKQRRAQRLSNDWRDWQVFDQKYKYKYEIKYKYEYERNTNTNMNENTNTKIGIRSKIQIQIWKQIQMLKYKEVCAVLIS